MSLIQMSFKRLKLLIRYNFFYPLASLFPRRLSYKLGSLIGLLNGYFDKQGISASVEGLISVFPQMDKNVATRLAKNQRCMLSREFLDVYWLDRITQNNIEKFITLEGLENLEAAKQKNRPVILYSAHFGRLIMPSMALGALGTKTSCLLADITNKNIPHVERRYLKKKVQAMERLMGGRMIQKTESLRKLYEVLDSKGILIIIIDAPPDQEDTIKEFPFLGGYARLSTGIVKLAMRRDAILVPYFAIDKVAGLTGIFLPPFSVTGCSEEEALRKIFEPVEAYIERYPDHWWMWDKLAAIWHKGH